jgi:alkylated DNA nucleotide flippase Atl1
VSGPPTISAFAEAVIDLVDRVPPGRVVAYGDVAALVGGGGPRQVGHVMAHLGGATAWWRVVRSDGRPARGLESEALARLRDEGTPIRGGRVDMRAARWDGARA